MKESAFRKSVAKGLKCFGVVRQVENDIGSGMPDTNWLIDGVEGWIELKVCKGWPARPSTPLRIEHYSITQKRWGMKQLIFGGRWSLLVKVGRDYLVFTTKMGLLVGEDGKTKQWLFDNCSGSWTGRIDFDELVVCLKGAK